MRIIRSGEINLLLFAIPPGDVHDNTPRIVIQPVQRLNAARFWKHSAHQRRYDVSADKFIWVHAFHLSVTIFSSTRYPDKRSQNRSEFSYRETTNAVPIPANSEALFFEEKPNGEHPHNRRFREPAFRDMLAPVTMYISSHADINPGGKRSCKNR